MSSVTNVMLHTGAEREDIKAMVLAPHDWGDRHGERFGDLVEGDALQWGGTKHPEIRLYGGAFNYLPWAAFAAWVESVPWRHPYMVQVFVKGEYDMGFTIWQIEDGSLVEVGCPDE